MKKKELKLYVWEGVLCDYTCGLVVALAYNEEEAWELLYKEAGAEWSELMFGKDKYWSDEEIKQIRDEYKAKHINLNLATLQKIWLERNNIKIYKNAVRPKEITKPSVFYVWGGG